MQHSPQPVLEGDLRLPPQQLPGPCDVRLAHLRVVDRQRLEHDLARRAGGLDHLLRELEQRVLGWIADVDRQVLAAFGKQHQTPDEIVHVTEASRLRAIAKHRQRLVCVRLAHERRNCAAVVRPHPRSVGVEDAHDARVHALLAVVRHRQRLRVPLRLVVDAARADRVDVAPVRLRLRVHLRVAVDLARGGEQEACALPLREPERVVRAVRADLERVQRHAQVVDRARERGEVVDEVDGLGDLDVLGDVVVEERERVAPKVLDVRERARDEVVDADHAVAAIDQ